MTLLNKWIKRKTKAEEYRKYVKDSIIHLEAGKRNYLGVLYSALLSKDYICVNLAANVIHNIMKEADFPKIINLNCQFRQYTSMEWTVEWKEVCLSKIKQEIDKKEEYVSVVRLGTFHPNGYYRENCMKELENDGESLPYFILRLNDWVEPVRNRAYELAIRGIEKATFDEVLTILPYFYHMKKGLRREAIQLAHVEQAIEQKIGQQIGKTELYRLQDYNFYVRRFLYPILFQAESLTWQQANSILRYEKSGYCKAIIINQILEKYDCSLEELDNFMKNKSAVVRRKALDYKYALTKQSWNGIEKLLLDTSKGIRSNVCYILSKHTNFDITAFYKGYLHTGYEKTAILGIGENGTYDHAELLMEYLNAESPRLRRNAIKSLARLLGTKGKDIYWHYLTDACPMVVKSAYEAVKNNQIQYGAKTLYEAYQACGKACSQKYFLYLLMQEPSWSRLPYLLLLYNKEGTEKLTEQIRKQIESRSTYGTVSVEEAEEIRDIMYKRKLQIPEKVIKEIELDLKYVVKDHSL